MNLSLRLHPALAVFFALILFTGASARAQEPLAAPGKLLYSDDFEGDALGDAWTIVIPAFTVEGGVLRGTQARADHGAVGAVRMPLPDCVVAFKFRYAAGTTFNAVFDDKTFKGSHAGHICRVAFTPRQIRLGDDKEGIMRNDIFEMRRDPARKVEAEKLLEGRGTVAKVELVPDRWYQARIELAGDEMRLFLDGALLASLKSPGIAHPTKNSFHFTVTGSEAQFDELRIWAAGAAK